MPFILQDLIEGYIWGDGILQNSIDYLTTLNLDEELGLRELRSLVNSTKHKPDIEWFGGERHPPNKLSMYADFCFGGDEARDIVRTYLDSGVLCRSVEKYRARLVAAREEGEGFSCRNAQQPSPDYVLLILGAGAMSLGCGMLVGDDSPITTGRTFWPTFRSLLVDIVEYTPLSKESREQWKQALHPVTGFHLGVPYDFGNTTQWQEDLPDGNDQLLEYIAQHGPLQIIDDGPFKRIGRLGEDGSGEQQIFTTFRVIAAPRDEDFPWLPKVHTYDVCGGCGATEGLTLRCEGCRQRKYCSRSCQEAHCHRHRMVCTLSLHVVADILDGVAEGPGVDIMELKQTDPYFQWFGMIQECMDAKVKDDALRTAAMDGAICVTRSSGYESWGKADSIMDDDILEEFAHVRAPLLIPRGQLEVVR